MKNKVKSDLKNEKNDDQDQISDFESLISNEERYSGTFNENIHISIDSCRAQTPLRTSPT